LTQDAAGPALEATFDVMIQAMKEGKRVSIAGFGSFERRTRKARKGCHPHTGEPLDIPETTLPYFKASSTLKALIQEENK